MTEAWKILVIVSSCTYVGGTFWWGFLTLMDWHTSYCSDDRRRSARLVLATPVWPIVGAAILTRGFIQLFKDAWL